MLWFTWIALPLWLLITGGALASASRLHSKREIPNGWSKHHRAPSELPIAFRLGLAQQNIEHLEELLMEVSSAGPSFGRHYTAKQVSEMFSPSTDTVDAVKAWLEHAGINAELSPNSGWLQFTTPASVAEDLFKAEYHIWKGEEQAFDFFSLEHSLPAHIKPHVEVILAQPVSSKQLIRRGSDHRKHHHARKHRAYSLPGSPTLKPRQSTSDQAALPFYSLSASDIPANSTELCSRYMTPACLQALYNMSTPTSVASNVSLGIVEFSPQSYLSAADLSNFMRKFRPEATDVQPQIELIDGAVIDDTDIPSTNFVIDLALHGEANLDTQFSTALVHPVPVTYYQVGRADGLGFFNAFLDAVDASYCTADGGDDLRMFNAGTAENPSYYPLDDPNFPAEECGAFPLASVISMSYGHAEVFQPGDYQERQCREFGKLGLMGTTVLFSSGDLGVAQSSGCINPEYGGQFSNGSSYTDGTSGLFSPQFPASCPWVTSVGATMLPPSASVEEPEVVAYVPLTRNGYYGTFSSGGGFSNLFPRPDYQHAAVEAWLADSEGTRPSDTLFNTTGRGYPDIAATGVNFTISLQNDSYTYLYGTSASAPVVASVITLINNERALAGKGPVGFINPVLYNSMAALNHISSGHNIRCGTDGFSAGNTWSPTVGNGTPDYTKLLEVFMALP